MAADCTFVCPERCVWSTPVAYLGDVLRVNVFLFMCFYAFIDDVFLVNVFLMDVFHIWYFSWMCLWGVCFL